jgi:hypothetical protein|tara:strand:- start:673 stop:876 length:204 start_codon:yes stop_codon:yes gene_type:complete
MGYHKSYSIMLFDKDKNKDVEFLPIHIKHKYKQLHDDIIKFIEARNNDKSTYIFDGYGGWIERKEKV